MVSTTAQQLRLALSTPTDDETETKSEQKLAQLALTKAQIRQIQRGEAKIHEKYLSDQCLIKYWDEAFGVVFRVMFWDRKDGLNYKGVVARLAGLEDQADVLGRSLYTAVRDGHLTLDIRHALHQKWRIYDQMIDAFDKEVGTIRLSMDWPFLDSALFGKDKFDKQLSAKKQSNKEIIATLWVNFAVLTVASLSFLGVGFFYSSGASGHWRDPHFWFLLQSSAVQLGGLFITALSFDSASGYDWASGGAATIFAISHLCCM